MGPDMNCCVALVGVLFGCIIQCPSHQDTKEFCTLVFLACFYRPRQHRNAKDEGDGASSSLTGPEIKSGWNSFGY